MLLLTAFVILSLFVFFSDNFYLQIKRAKTKPWFHSIHVHSSPKSAYFLIFRASHEQSRIGSKFCADVVKVPSISNSSAQIWVKGLGTFWSDPSRCSLLAPYVRIWANCARELRAKTMSSLLFLPGKLMTKFMLSFNIALCRLRPCLFQLTYRSVRSKQLKSKPMAIFQIIDSIVPII